MNLTIDASTRLRKRVASNCHHHMVAEPLIAHITAPTGRSGAVKNRSGQWSWQQSCWFWESGKGLVLRVCHPCLCLPVSQKLKNRTSSPKSGAMEEHMNTAGQANRDAGLRAQVAENRVRSAETTAIAAAGAAGVRQGTVPSVLVGTRLLGKPRTFSGALADW